MLGFDPAARNVQPVRPDPGVSEAAAREQRLLVVGCGSIGRRHIANLLALGQRQISACDPDPERRDAVSAEFNIQTYPSFEDATSDALPGAVLVCTPPHLHLLTCRAALALGAHLFVEKPISDRSSGVAGAVKLARSSGRVLMVGYNLRFHPGPRTVRDLLAGGAVGRVLWARAEFGQYLPDWRPGRDYRQSYTARAGMGGGILLDASHELDYLRWLLGEVDAVCAFAGRLSDLEVDVEDTAALLLRFTSGALGEVHLDFVERGYSRGCKIVGNEGTIAWRFGGDVELYRASTGSWQRLDARSEPNQMYLDELRHFLACVAGEAEPPVDGPSALRTLELVEAAKQAALEERWVHLT